VTPRILGFLTVGITMLFIVRLRLVLYSAGSGVKSVPVDLSGFRVSSFSIVHSNSVFRYGCMFCCAVCMFGCDVKVLMSSAYE